jgi:hypothetical protein
LISPITDNEMAEFYLVTREARETAASEPR